MRVCVFLAVLALAPAGALADVIHFKDGTVKEVEIYHETETYVSFVYKGKLAGAAKSMIKKIEHRDEPVCDVKKILAQKAAERKKASGEKKLSGLDRLKAKAAEEKKKAAEERKKMAEVLEKAFNPASGSEGSSSGGKAPAGVEVVPRSKSKTGEAEVIVDPFPDERRGRRR